MGSQLTPILPQYIMDICISRLDFLLAFVKKFVDDIILALPEDKITQTLQIFNDFDTNIKFTIEMEDEYSVPFLDTKTIRRDNTVMLD